MGPSQSTESRLAYIQTPTAAAYAAILSPREDHDKRLFDHLEEPQTSSTNQLLKTAYHGTWSMIFPSSICPLARIGQCSVLDPINNRLIIAYGLSANGEELNDAWILELSTHQWRILSSSLLGARQYPSATLLDRQMIIFGGLRGHEFLADLHSIDIDTGNTTRIINSPFGPSPRISPILNISNDHQKLFLWGGFDGTVHSEAYFLDFKSGSWSTDQEEHPGRAAAAYCDFGDQHYVFGSSKGHGLLKLNPDEKLFEEVISTGSEPQAELTHSALVAADEYLFVIGGEADFGFMHLFAFEVKRKWWFAFHVRPDGETLTLSDGIVNKIGLFMMPREYSASIVYSHKNRELVSVMGSKLIDPPPIFTISIGEALGLLHLRSDMLELFDAQVRPGS